MATVLDVIGEPLQKLRILAFVNGSEGGGRDPAAGIDDRAIGDLTR